MKSEDVAKQGMKLQKSKKCKKTSKQAEMLNVSACFVGAPAGIRTTENARKSTDNARLLKRVRKSVRKNAR